MELTLLLQPHTAFRLLAYKVKTQPIPSEKPEVLLWTRVLCALLVVLNSGYIIGSLGMFEQRCLCPVSDWLNQNLQELCPGSFFSLCKAPQMILKSARMENHYATLLLLFKLTKWPFKGVSCKWLRLQYKCLLRPHCNYIHDDFCTHSLLDIF